MKKLILLCTILLFTTVVFAQDTDTETSKYFLIRHTEKQVDGTRNPHLTKKGVARAKRWGEILKSEKIDVVYSTDYFRTKETASNLIASYLGDGNLNRTIEVKIYDPRKNDLKKFLKKTSGKNVVIVGHSNSTPSFVNDLIGKKKYEEIDESIYGNLYIVSKQGNFTTATLFHIQ